MKRIYIFTFLVLIAVSVTAQNTDRPWLFGISTNYADFEAVEMSVGNQFSDANWMGKTLPSQFKIGRLLNKSFNIAAEFSTITLEPDKLNEMPTETFVSTDKFWRIGGQFEYKFANGYLLKEEARFDPYIFLGANGSNINEKTYFTQSTGLGFNVWLTDWFGVNAEGSYDYIFDWNDYFHYSLGIVFRVGKKADMDGDGVADKDDKCPEVPGLKELEGCPDADGDGITDHLDRCPQQAGPAEFKGCPDSDGDGIPDIDDECPTVPGLVALKGCPDNDGDGIPDHLDECPDLAGLPQYKGCPDRDGDGIPDHLDECPDVRGIAQFKGCPDTDGDGIPDHLDQCPNERGPASNNGCPIPQEVIEAISFNAQNVFFETSSSKIKQDSFKNLDEIVTLMKKYPDTRFTVHGHTDITGRAEMNLQLSKDRAKSVADYFTSKGIEANRLDVEGFGITKPIATNDTSEGRAKNRRVEIKLID